ncbi:MAG TPA: 4-hydroxythreonine-4-phosphate dehydrogenase PdxA [Candidatus Binataceae bacterium]|nr:4-hydroxythreonine-4-phosphate dehydrogenase PdxA [Candidatus Binataceae bacterium]
MAALRKTSLIAVTMGDPAGVGPEVILKAAAARARRPGAPSLVVIGDPDVMERAAKGQRGVPRLCQWSPGDAAIPLANGIGLLECVRMGSRAPAPGRPNITGGQASFDCVVSGARMALKGEVDGLVTAPISKEWWHRAGHDFPGHSELLAKLARTPTWRMMFGGGQLRIALVTVHIGLAEVAPALTRDRVFQTIRLLADHLKDQLGCSRPRISVLGLNPHAGENGLFGQEEIKIIAPAIARARREGIEANGPIAPDTAFIRQGGGFRFDGAVAMYHDQGLIALKTLEFDRAVNITLGLPFVRTSPDHGTAFDIAGRGLASGNSMAAAIEYAASAAQTRRTNGRRAA